MLGLSIKISSMNDGFKLMLALYISLSQVTASFFGELILSSFKDGICTKSNFHNVSVDRIEKNTQPQLIQTKFPSVLKCPKVAHTKNV